MASFGKGNFGSGIEINAQVVSGKCPLCESDGLLVSIHKAIFRCMHCGSDIEQKVNGKISYMPLGSKIILASPKDLTNG